MQTGTAIAIANARQAAGLLSPRNFRLGYEDLMNALMSILVNTLTLEAVIGCFSCFLFPFLLIVSNSASRIRLAT